MKHAQQKVALLATTFTKTTTTTTYPVYLLFRLLGSVPNMLGAERGKVEFEIHVILASPYT